MALNIYFICLLIYSCACGGYPWRNHEGGVKSPGIEVVSCLVWMLGTEPDWS